MREDHLSNIYVLKLHVRVLDKKFLAKYFSKNENIFYFRCVTYFFNIRLFFSYYIKILQTRESNFLYTNILSYNMCVLFWYLFIFANDFSFHHGGTSKVQNVEAILVFVQCQSRGSTNFRISNFVFNFHYSKEFQGIVVNL